MKPYHFPFSHAGVSGADTIRRCRGCGIMLYGEDRFCPCCGERVEEHCPACGTLLRHMNGCFCTGCGEKIKGSEEIGRVSATSSLRRASLHPHLRGHPGIRTFTHAR